MLSDNLVAFVREIKVAYSGLGKVKAQTVKDMVEYARVHKEAQIRNARNSDVVEADKSNIYSIAMGNNQLVSFNIDGKPLEKLIEVVSKGIGTLYRPRSIRKDA